MIRENFVKRSRSIWFWPLLLAASVPALAQQVDIRNYGAKCNGGDDVAAVQAAINAVPDGGTVVVSCQAGIGAAGLNLESHNNVTIQGAGNGAGFTSLAPTGNTINGISWSSLLRIVNCTRCAVRNVEFQMNYQPVAAMGLNYNTGTIIDGNHISNIGNGVPNSANHAGPSAAIEAALNTSNQYTNNVIQHAIGWYGGPANGQSDGPRGMWIGNTGSVETSPLIANNTITDTFHSGMATNTDNSTITGNHVYNAGTGSNNQKAGGACIKETNIASVQTTIANNDFNFCNQGVQVENAGNITIQNNRIQGMLDSGVYESNTTINLKIIGNTFANGKTGIALQGGNNWTISDNSFVNDPGQQQVGNVIRITPLWPGKPIQNITISNNNIGTNLDGGVHIHDEGGQVAGPISITNNNITNSAAAGIVIQQTASGAINNIAQSGNCFAADAGGAVTDSRGMLASPGESGACAGSPAVSLTSPVNSASQPDPAPAPVVSVPAAGAPAVSLNSPNAYATYFAPATLLLEASANGNGSTITLVEYYANSTKIGESNSSPFVVFWTNVPAGTYTLTAKATSSAGPSTTSAGMTLVVE